MKRLTLAIFASFIVAVAVLDTGCGSTPAEVAYKGEALIIQSIDLGMKLWADQVNAGNATQKQVDEVKAAYNVYYNAQQAAKAALMKYLASQTKDSADVQAANAAVVNAENALLSILNQFILK